MAYRYYVFQVEVCQFPGFLILTHDWIHSTQILSRTSDKTDTLKFWQVRALYQFFFTLMHSTLPTLAKGTVCPPFARVCPPFARVCPPLPILFYPYAYPAHPCQGYAHPSQGYAHPCQGYAHPSKARAALFRPNLGGRFE
jgi:hypothetical protein